MITLNLKSETKITESNIFFLENGVKNINIDNNSEIILSGQIKFGENISLSGKITISDGAIIENGCIFKNVNIGKNNTIRAYSILEDSEFGDKNIIGPFCFVRDNTKVGDECIVGNQVELARSTLANGVKISHQAFMGDMIIDQNTIIGAGCISCNYSDGKRYLSKIGSFSVIGSGSLLVSPVNIGNNVIVGAGSVVLKDISNNTKLIQKRK